VLDVNNRQIICVCAAWLCLSLLTTSCVSTGLVRSAACGATVWDEVGPVQQAYRTPAGDWLFCATGALAASHEERPYTIYVAHAQHGQALTDCGYRGRLIELPRSVIRSGWPDAACVKREHLTPIPIRSVSSGLIVGAELDAWRQSLRVAKDESETIYNVSGYGTGIRWKLIHVRRNATSDADEVRAFTIVPATTHPKVYRLAYLPFATLLDAVSIVGSLGGGIPPEALTAIGENIGEIRH
jgi:hypothetical protein